MKSMSQVLKVARTTRDAVNKWQDRGQLPVELPATTAGVTRLVDERTALGLAFMAALTRLPVSTKMAGYLAGEWLRQFESGSIEPLWIWNLEGDPVVDAAEWSDLEIPLSLIGEISRGRRVKGKMGGYEVVLPVPETEIAIVNRREIIRRVQALFQLGAT
jgi:hypothetical protein